MEGSILRGDIVILDFGSPKNHTVAKVRPALILQNNLANKHSGTTIVAVITSNERLAKLPIGVRLEPGTTGLDKTSYVNLSQIYTIDQDKIHKKIGTIPKADMTHVDRAIKISLGLEQHTV